MSKDYSGPTYDCESVVYAIHDSKVSLRNQFAMAALTGLIARDNPIYGNDLSQLVDAAFKIADMCVEKD